MGVVFFCEAHHEIKMLAHFTLHMCYNTPSTYMYIMSKMCYGVRWAHAIVPVRCV
jgi:hypothetical protein